MPIRPGYYVERRLFGDKFHQACARAKHLANEFGRPVTVEYLAPEDLLYVNTCVPSVICTFRPNRAAARTLKSDWLPPFVGGAQTVVDFPDLRGFMVPNEGA